MVRIEKAKAVEACASTALEPTARCRRVKFLYTMPSRIRLYFTTIGTEAIVFSHSSCNLPLLAPVLDNVIL
jgi:hypothetical protein